jgi:hypothetical protein
MLSVHGIGLGRLAAPSMQKRSGQKTLKANHISPIMRNRNSPAESSCGKTIPDTNTRQADQSSPHAESLDHLLFQQPQEHANAKGTTQIPHSR